jgi:hypothetical protein
MTESQAPIVWEAELPLFSRRMVAQWSMAMAVTAAVMALILGTVFVAQQEWDAIRPMLLMISLITAALWGLGFVIMAVVFRGRYRVRYTLSSKRLVCDTVDRAARTANRMAIVAGALARSPQALGAGLIGVSRESESVSWKGAFRARYEPETRSIYLRNAWRTLMWVQCTPNNYATVAAAIGQFMSQHKTTDRSGGKSPLPAYLGRTALAVSACIPLFPLAESFHTGLFIPILILCFALATVWMINLFGWVVIGGLLAQSGLLMASLLETRESFFHRGEFYRAYEVLGGDDLNLMLVASVGAVILIRLSVQALRGRWLAALIAGFQDMGD